MQNELNEFLIWTANMLEDAAVSIDEWGAYAPQYYKEKWHLVEDVKKYQDAAAIVRRYIKNGTE